MADYKIKHVGLNSIILTSDNGLVNSFIVGTNYGILEQIARWGFNTPSEIEFRPVKPIVDIANSADWYSKLYITIYRSLANGNDRLIDETSVKPYVSRITFDKEFSNGNILPTKSVYTSFELAIFKKEDYGKLKIVSSLAISHHLWSSSKSEQTEHIEQIEFLRTIKNKLAYLLKYSHLTATDVNDFELALMGHYLDRLLES